MVAFIAGLVIFLGVHSTRVFAEGWRNATLARIGEKPWKGVYSLVSLASFVLLVWGYGRVRGEMPVWYPPLGMHYVTVVLMIPAFILLVAAYWPRNGIKARLHHPMILSVKVWAFAHLLSNGNLPDVLLFGGFLAWAIADYAVARKRDRAAAVVDPPGSAAATIGCVIVGLVIYVAFVMGVHRWLIGVPVL